ncbi:Zinc finger, BED-type, partial [Dillenia turbinata]
IMVRGRDACWEHCVLVDATRQKVRCNYCQREFSGGVYRMKFHLAQIKNKDIVPCAEVPNDVRDHIRSILNTPKKQKTPKKRKVDHLDNGQQNSSSASGGFHPDPGSSGQRGSTCPSLLFPRLSPSSQLPVDDVQKLKQDNADKRIAVFFFHNSIPLSAAKSVYYQEMMDAEDNLKHMFSHTEWLSSVYGRRPDAQAVKMRNGFQEAMMKMATEDKEKVEVTKEHPIYINAQGALGTDFAVMGRTLNAPGDWWASYGYEIPTLQRTAIRILSQPCSSHWCRWNWSTFENIHGKRRNRLELEKFNDLVFVHCNLWLQSICQGRDGKSKPIIFDEIDVSSEWPTESDPSSPLLDDSWLDNLPLECRGNL